MNALISYFGSAFLINLPERVDRLEAARQELQRIDSDIAPDQVSLYAAQRFKEAAGFSTPGERGCFHSHLSCLQQALQKGSRGVLVFEDDIALTSALPALAPTLVEYLSTQDWDLMYFGHEDTGDVPRATGKTSPADLVFREFVGNLTCAHFYAVNGKTLPRLVRFLEQLLERPPGSPEGGPMPLDGGINYFREKNPEIRAHLVVPKLGWQRPSRSDLTPKWIDSLPWARGVVGKLRGIKQMTQRWRA